MADTGMVMTFGDVPELFLLDNPEGPQTEPQDTPGAPFDEPIGDPTEFETNPSEAPGDTTATGESESTGNGEAVQGSGENSGGTVKPTEPCDHTIYNVVSIGASVLSLVLIVVVILQALRMRSAKKRISQLNKRKPQAVETAPVVAAPAEKISVGKLHCQGARSSQQDCLAVSPAELYGQKGLLALVADGMGGLSDGDRMSQAAASAMMNGFMGSQGVAASDLILALTTEANQTVNRLLGPQKGKSGTTLVGGIVKDGLFHYVSVGDSRICLFRQGQLTQLNREHVYRNELATQAINGVGTLWDANTHPKAGALTSYLGMGNLKYVDIPAEPIKLRGGDKIILMSDGVYNAMSLLELESSLAKPAQQAADAIGQIINAKAYRNQDNYTAVILEF